MRDIARAARSRNTHDTGFVAPEPSCESTEAITLEEYRTMVQPKRPRNDAEYEMQCALIAWRDRLVGQYPVLSALVHWPSGEHRSKASAVRIKRLGGSRGLPDIWLLVPQSGQQNGIAWHRPGMCLELKAGKNKLSADQERWRAILETCHFAYYEVRDDWTIAARLIAAWCGLPEGVVP